MFRQPPRDPPGAITLSELIGQAATLTEDEIVEEVGAAFLLLHRVDLGRPQTGDTIEASTGDEGSTADLGFLALPLKRGAGGRVAVGVGRSRDNEIVLEHRTVSKVHARLEEDEAGVFFVTDLGSRNGTLVDGVVLGAEDVGPTREVASRQTVRFGSVSLTFVSPADLLEFGRLLVRR